jgi:WbqC-like protein family
MAMRIAIHQPHFLPWLGYLHRMASVDAFVLLDHVQFERRNYQNRTMIRRNGAPHWLTVPVVQRSQQERILDKQLDNGDGGERWWGALCARTLQHVYGKARFYREYAPALKALLETRHARLVDLNQAALDWLRGVFGVRTPLLRSSELGVGGARAGLILEICRAVKADALLAGMGGSRAYLDAGEFARNGVRIEWHEFRHPVYPQPGPQPFLPGLSAIDMLFHAGPGQWHEIRQAAPARKAA